jgi:hypothetical protein
VLDNIQRIFPACGDSSVINSPESSSEQSLLDPGKYSTEFGKATKRILGSIKAMIYIDKQKLHHKLIYRHAYILASIFGDFESGKDILFNLLQINSPSRCFKGLSKCEYERLNNLI